MSQEYYSVEKESNLGVMNIGLSVFQTIGMKVVESEEGVSFEESMISMPGSNQVIVHLNKNNQVTMDIAIMINYGLNVTTVTNSLQTKIVQSCYEMTGTKNIKVNIEVKGIIF